MDIKDFHLSLRQIQVLVDATQKIHSYGLCKVSDLLGTTGVGHATLFDHIKALQDDGYIQTPLDAEGKQRLPFNLSAPDQVFVTQPGNKLALDILNFLGVTINESATSVFQKLKKEFEPKWVQKNLFGTKNTSFAKAFEELVLLNPLEPVLTTISMYNELDNQLNLIRTKDPEEYIHLSRVQLNLEIRNGRLASLVIPIAVRNQTKQTSIKKMLGESWSWAGTVSATSMRRYWAEATSLSLIQVVGNSVQSLKNNTTDTISWLAEKTNFTFANTIPTAPKCALVLFRESYRLPTEDDILDPRNSDKDLQWLRFIYENMVDKTDYISAVEGALKTLKDRTNIIQEYEGAIVPTNVIRLISEEKEVKTVFDKMLTDDSTITSRLLRAISAKPSISVYEISAAINKEGRHSKEDIVATIRELARKNLIHMANSRYASEDCAKLFSFVHVPYLYSDRAKEAKEANALLRGMNPYLLQQVRDLFPTKGEGDAVIEKLRLLMADKEIELDNLSLEYGKIFERKMYRFAWDLEPFVNITPDQSRIVLNKRNSALNNIVINTLIYSIIARNDALDVYTNVISGLAEHDKSWSDEAIDEAKDMTNTLTSKNQKRLSAAII